MQATDATGHRPAQPDAGEENAGLKQLAIKDYRSRGRRKVVAIVGLFLLAFVAFVVATIVGPIDLSVHDLFLALTGSDGVDQRTHTVLWQLRLPASVMALLVGAALGLSGAFMQTILDNPLAEPFTLGISAAAAFGAAFSIVMGWTILANPQFNLALLTSVSALLAVVVVAAASLWRGASAEVMILLGIALSFFFQALLSLMQYGASTEALQQIVFWTMGSMQRANWTSNGIIGVVLLLALPYAAASAWKLTALRLGDDRAASLGVNVKALRIATLVVASVLAAAAVAFAGIIGFIGLVGPHIARMLVGEDQAFFLPASVASGAVLMTVAYAVSISIVPGVAIPIGIITALVGVPFFVFLIFSRRKGRS